MVRSATASDAGTIARIYNHYVSNSVITFEEHPISAEQMLERIGEVLVAPLPWLVAEREGRIAGYAFASKWKARSAYRFSVEATIYVEASAVGAGIGTELYESLFASIKSQGAHAVIGGIALPNPASVAIHEKFGLRKVAHFEQVGFKFGQWIDVGYWQKLL